MARASAVATRQSRADTSGGGTMTDFESWLQKGLGRAAMILTKHDGGTYRGPLLHACTHNSTYDPQCEDGRAPYLLDLIKLSGEPDYYRHCVLTALLSHDEDED